MEKIIIKSAVHLCDECENYNKFPTCIPDEESELKFGNGLGDDNIIHCVNFKQKK